jgi:hypothetical protein
MHRRVIPLLALSYVTTRPNLGLAHDSNHQSVFCLTTGSKLSLKRLKYHLPIENSDTALITLQMLLEFIIFVQKYTNNLLTRN